MRLAACSDEEDVALGPAAAPIALQPLGDVAPVELQRITRVVARAFGAKTLALPPAPLDPAFLVRERKQYDADLLLDELFTRLPERSLRIVGVTESDLYVQGRTFVFGYAHLTDGMAVYSLNRLREEFYGRRGDDARVDARVRRALVHELGHTFGVPHCDDERCVMRVVSQIDSLDALPPRYCTPCKHRVSSGLAIAPWSAVGRFERGMAHFRRRQFPRAIAHLEHAVRCAPLDGRYRHALALAQLAARGSDVVTNDARV